MIMNATNTSASGLPDLPEPFAWKCTWLMPDGESTWEQWHYASDPLPTQWDDEAPDTITEVFTADQLRARDAMWQAQVDALKAKVEERDLNAERWAAMRELLCTVDWDYEGGGVAVAVFLMQGSEACAGPEGADLIADAAVAARTTEQKEG